MSGAVVSATFSAVQLVYAAYRDVRSNKERCTTLVTRAEFVVDQLQSLIDSQGEESIAEQLGVLQSAFEETARVIKNVGHQNWFMALLNSDRDTVQIEHCHRCLTDLMALYNIEQTIDQRVLQSANERARRHDHKELIYVAQGVQSELIAQGEMIGEVLQMVRSLSSQSFEDHTQATSQPSLARQRATSPVVCIVASGPAATPGVHSRRTGSVQSASETPTPRRLRRQSWKNKWQLQVMPAVFRRSLPATKTISTKEVIKPTILSGSKSGPACPLTSPSPLPGAPGCFRVDCHVQANKFLPSPTPSRPCGNGPPESNNVSDASESCLGPSIVSSHSTHLTLTPTDRPMSSQSIACSDIFDDWELDTLPHTSTVTDDLTAIPGRFASPLRGSTHAGFSLSRPEMKSRPPYGSKYVELRYYSGNVSSGVLLSEAFETLGQTSLSELKLACSRPSDPTLLARLDESNLVMWMPENLQPTSMLQITPLTTHKCPVLIIWVLKSHVYNTHLEPIKVIFTKQNLGPEWALVACDKSTRVEGLTKIVGELVGGKACRCFRRGEGGRFQIANTRLLRDCGVGRGMYLEVEVE